MPKSRDITIGSLLQLIIRIAGMLSGALVAALQARTLSVSEFGSLSLIFSINAMAIILTDMGIMNTAIRRLAGDPDDRERIVSGLLTSRFLIGLLLSVIGIGASSILLESPEAVYAAILILAALPLSSLTATQALSQAKLHFAAVNSLLILQNFLWLTVVSLLALLDASLPYFGIGFLICAVVQGITTWFLCGRGLRFDWKSGLRETWPLLKQALPLGLGSLAVTAYYRLTGIILFAADGSEAAGNFSAAFRFLDVLQAIPATLSGTLLPLMARSFSMQRPDRAEVIWGLAIKLLMTAAVIASVGVGLLSGPIVHLLYGEEYADSAELLGILMIAFTPVCMGWLLTGVITAKGKLKEYAVVAASVAAASIVASFVLIPVFGARGAAWVTVGTEILVMVLLAMLVNRHTGFTIAPGLVVRICGAALVTAGAIVYVRPSGLFWALAAGGLAAVGSVWLFRVVTRSDMSILFHRADTLDDQVSETLNA